MFQDDVDDNGVVIEYPYPWDNDPDRSQPKTPLHRPNPHDPMEPRRRRDRFRGRVADDGSFTSQSGRGSKRSRTEIEGRSTALQMYRASKSTISKRSRTEIEERSNEPQPENKRSRLSLQDIQTNHLPLRLDSDGHSGNGVGVEQDHELEIPDELLELLLEEDQHVSRRPLDEGLPERSGLPSDDDDDDDDLYVAGPDML
ncbi:hypothetical protein ACEPAH_7586 [Sanghuangporus vaninii]